MGMGRLLPWMAASLSYLILFQDATPGETRISSNAVGTGTATEGHRVEALAREAGVPNAVFTPKCRERKEGEGL